LDSPARTVLPVPRTALARGLLFLSELDATPMVSGGAEEHGRVGVRRAATDGTAAALRAPILRGPRRVGESRHRLLHHTRTRTARACQQRPHVRSALHLRREHCEVRRTGRLVMIADCGIKNSGLLINPQSEFRRSAIASLLRL